VIKLDPASSAVLTLDCQKGIVAYVPGSESILPPAAKVLAAARAKGLRVLHVGIGFRPGYPEIPPSHPMAARVKDSGGRFLAGTDSTEPHPRLDPKPEEFRIVKHRVSGFSGSDLEMLLRAQGIQRLVLFGIATSGIVLSTVRQASDLDFRCVVIKDCCFDGDDEVHRVLTEKVFPKQADVVDSETFLREAF
jgi:nicotinamidase-related amidase